MINPTFPDFPEIKTSGDAEVIVKCLEAIFDGLYVVNQNLENIIESSQSVDEAIRTTVI